MTPNVFQPPSSFPFSQNATGCRPMSEGNVPAFTCVSCPSWPNLVYPDRETGGRKGSCVPGLERLVKRSAFFWDFKRQERYTSDITPYVKDKEGRMRASGGRIHRITSLQVESLKCDQKCQRL